jgi:hypothetical protein
MKKKKLEFSPREKMLIEAIKDVKNGMTGTEFRLKYYQHPEYDEDDYLTIRNFIRMSNSGAKNQKQDQ